MLDLRADGSNRALYRLLDADGRSVVGVFGPDAEENRAFLSFSASLRGAGLPVPEIFAANEAEGVYIEEDLGDLTLFDAVTAAREGLEGPGHPFPQSAVPLYERVVELLPRVQILGGRVVDFSVAYPCAEFDRRSMMWDLSYFKYHFLKLARVPFNESRLEADFSHLCDRLLATETDHFLYRDFQSRNIMLRDGDPWLIDYQGGRRGALQYDIASLLYDAKADIPEELRVELLDRYITALGQHLPVDRAAFVELYRHYVLIRILQAMGAYGYRGFFERKAHFLASVPYAVANLERLLDVGVLDELPELRVVIERIAGGGFSEEGRGDGSEWRVASSEQKENQMHTHITSSTRSADPAKGTRDGDDQTLSRPAGMAGGDVIGTTGISRDGAFPASGAVRPEVADAASGSVDPLQHSGGIRTSSSEGVPSLPVDSAGITGGAGDPDYSGVSADLPRTRRDEGAVGAGSIGGTIDDGSSATALKGGRRDHDVEEPAAPNSRLATRQPAPAARDPQPASVAHPASSVQATGPLHLTITSFSYKRGYPEDTSGHGGGFVFDCRALHNPGRYPEYAARTGLDAEVIAFLEGSAEVERFWESVRAIVDASLERYLARGFAELSVAFGCTGGQHRSVYMAERLARHVGGRYESVRADLRHRERARWPAGGAAST